MVVQCVVLLFLFFKFSIANCLYFIISKGEYQRITFICLPVLELLWKWRKNLSSSLLRYRTEELPNMFFIILPKLSALSYNFPSGPILTFIIATHKLCILAYNYAIGRSLNYGQVLPKEKKKQNVYAYTYDYQNSSCMKYSRWYHLDRATNF